MVEQALCGQRDSLVWNPYLYCDSIHDLYLLDLAKTLEADAYKVLIVGTDDERPVMVTRRRPTRCPLNAHHDWTPYRSSHKLWARGREYPQQESAPAFHWLKTCWPAHQGGIVGEIQHSYPFLLRKFACRERKIGNSGVRHEDIRTFP